MVNLTVKCEPKEPKTDRFIPAYDYSIIFNGVDISGNVLCPSDGTPAMVIEIPGSGAPPRVTMTLDIDTLDLGAKGELK